MLRAPTMDKLGAEDLTQSLEAKHQNQNGEETVSEKVGHPVIDKNELIKQIVDSKSSKTLDGFSMPLPPSQNSIVSYKTDDSNASCLFVTQIYKQLLRPQRSGRNSSVN